MKKKLVYILTVVFFFASVGFLIHKYIEDKHRDAVIQYTLKERTGHLSLTGEWEKTRKMADYYIESIKKDPKNTKALNTLASIFIQEERITGDYVYYDNAAMNCVNRVLEIDPINFEALTLKALLHLSQHHFADGLAVAEKAQKINPYNAFVYGILVDGNVEMGNYSAAVENSDKMISIRPDLRSYSRISYLREIYGDYPGAIEAMKLAVEAGAPGEESTEWSRVQLGQLFENVNDLPSSEMQYLISLDERPGYPYAIAGLARIALLKKDYAKALMFLKQADSSMNNNIFREEMIKVYKLNGQKDKAVALAREVINDLIAVSRKAENDHTIGHYADRELALAYLEAKDYDNAIKYALIEYNRRPMNIDVNETVAWIYYNRGEYQKALPFLETALKTHSKNPTLLNRASLILNQVKSSNNRGV
jgi:tetratricopeptide (TPR) repeat protein